MSQRSLFSDTILDACADTIEKLGGNKKVGERFKPGEDPDAAGRWLADCVNIKAKPRLNPQQLLCLARWGCEQGCHTLMFYFAREAGYTEPAPKNPEDEKAALQRQLIEAQKQMQIIVERWDRLTA